MGWDPAEGPRSQCLRGGPEPVESRCQWRDSLAVVEGLVLVHGAFEPGSPALVGSSGRAKNILYTAKQDRSGAYLLDLRRNQNNQQPEEAPMAVQRSADHRVVAVGEAGGRQGHGRC